jgi:hypothetical protein
MNRHYCNPAQEEGKGAYMQTVTIWPLLSKGHLTGWKALNAVHHAAVKRSSGVFWYHVQFEHYNTFSTTLNTVQAPMKM